MTTKKNSKRGLGKGLQALFAEIEEKDSNLAPVELPLKDIRAGTLQPRKEFSQEQIEELSRSIATYGVLQPIVVRRVIGGYELVAGERRWRAARMAGLSSIPAIVREFNDGEAMEVALIENLQREDLNPLEEAEAFQVLLNEFNLTQEDLSHRIGKSRSHIANTIRLLNLPQEIQKHVSRGTITMGHARALLALEEPVRQLAACQTIVDKSLSVRETEALVRKMVGDKEKKKKRSKRQEKREPYIVEIEANLQEILGTKVEIRAGNKKGRIEIEYYSEEDLERIYRLLGACRNN
ncbi:MAG: ParB/RepB/Spo0J family partition protein [bacterium]